MYVWVIHDYMSTHIPRFERDKTQFQILKSRSTRLIICIAREDSPIILTSIFSKTNASSLNVQRLASIYKTAYIHKDHNVLFRTKKSF